MIFESFLIKAMAAGTLAGISGAWVGSFAVLGEYVFLGFGVVHSAFAGIVLGLLFNINPLIPSLIVAVLVAIFISTISWKFNITKEVSTGIINSLSMAIAITLIGFLKGYHPEISTYLFGDILAVSWNDVYFLTINTAVVVTITLVLNKALLYAFFDPHGAKTIGIPAFTLQTLVMILMATTVVLTLKAIGALLTLAYLIIPPSTFLNRAHTIQSMAWGASIVAVVSSMIGMAISYLTDIPSGASTVLIMFIIFAVFRKVVKKCPLEK